MCAITNSYVRHDTFICVPWPIHMCAMPHSCACRDSCTRAQRLIPSYMWPHTFKRVTWLLHMTCRIHACDSRWMQKKGVLKISSTSAGISLFFFKLSEKKIFYFFVYGAVLLGAPQNCICNVTATHCNKLQWTTTHCNKLKHTAAQCNGFTLPIEVPK